MSASQGASPLHQVVVRIIASGTWMHRPLARAMKPHISGDALKDLLGKMHREFGLIHSKRGGWGLSDRGIAMLPRGGAMPPMRLWIPPAAPPRRAGSDAAARLPSVAGGRVLERAA